MRGAQRSALDSAQAFSLVEVVLALGIVAFAIVAILGAFPAALQTSRSSQSETRAAQIAQDVLVSLASQSQVDFSTDRYIKQSATLNASDFKYAVKLDGSTPSYIFSADNDGHLVVPNGTSANPYQVTVFVSNTPPIGFDASYAALVTVRVAWQPFAQNFRDFVRIITKY